MSSEKQMVVVGRNGPNNWEVWKQDWPSGTNSVKLGAFKLKSQADKFADKNKDGNEVLKGVVWH